MHIEQLRSELGEAFVENIVFTAPNQDMLRNAISMIQDACRRFKHASLRYTIMFNLIRLSAAQQFTEQDQRLKAASAMVKLLYTSGEISELYRDSMLRDLEDERQVQWMSVWVRPEPVDPGAITSAPV